MAFKLFSILALCALVCSAVAHLSGDLDPTYGSFAVLPIWTENAGDYYLVNFTIGSDNQTVPLIFDISSSETFINPDCFTFSGDAAEKQACLARSRYNLFTSSSAKFGGGSFMFSHTTWGEAAGSYVHDRVRICSTMTKAKNIGIAATSRGFSAGVFGVGRSAPGGQASIVEQMVEQDQISSQSFSVDLGSLDSAEPGTVILGGIDKKGFQGPLTRLEGTGFSTYLTAMGLTLPNGTSITFDLSVYNPNNTTGIPVSFDPNAISNSLPTTIVGAIENAYPHRMDYSARAGLTSNMVIPCEAVGGSFDYTFGNLTIQVPFADAVNKVSLEPSKCVLPFGSPQTDNHDGDNEDDENKEHMAVREADPSKFDTPLRFVLGTNLMRGAYVFFDMDEQRIWMAQRAKCGSDMIAVAKGGAGAIGLGCEHHENTVVV